MKDSVHIRTKRRNIFKRNSLLEIFFSEKNAIDYATSCMKGFLCACETRINVLLNRIYCIAYRHSDID